MQVILQFLIVSSLKLNIVCITEEKNVGYPVKAISDPYLVSTLSELYKN